MIELGPLDRARAVLNRFWWTPDSKTAESCVTQVETAFAENHGRPEWTTPEPCGSGSPYSNTRMGGDVAYAGDVDGDGDPEFLLKGPAGSAPNQAVVIVSAP